MRGVEERSLSSILRSKLLTTLINNDVSGKDNASVASALDKFDAMQMCFASESAEKKRTQSAACDLGSSCRFQDGLPHDLALAIHCRCRDRCLMNIQPNILFTGASRVLLS
jgi:hypothetical protein